MDFQYSTSQKPLKILNASAGSGKTYSLVKTYIKILLDDNKHASKFSEIIAMTFTNKAALEMKQRIIEKLDELSHPQIFKAKSTDFAQELAGELKIDPLEVHERSLEVLESILHRYEDFHVMTIDKFNLRLIRSFSLDLDLPNDFEVILNEDAIIEQVVDQLLDMNGKNDELSNLIFSYANSLTEDEQSWNIRRALVEFAKILKQESSFPIIEKLQELNFSKEEFTALKLEQTRFVNEFLEKCRAVFELFLSFQLEQNELPGASNTYRPILKLNNFEFYPKELFTLSFLQNCEKEPPKGKRFPPELRQALLDLNTYFSANVEKSEQYNLYLKNYYNMALLKYISQALLDLRSEERLIRISEFNKMISDLVSEDDAPYIYERMGTRYRHFMLDEFQDTSRLQWLNMTPLVHESLASNNSNLIVGDPKQSIYRFKNGVVQQFVELPGLYNPENNLFVGSRSEYFKAMGEVTNLENNWRSSKIIVDFNNQLFELIKEQIPMEFRDFYKSVYQHAKSDKAGYVSIVSSKVKKAQDPKEAMPFILDAIQECEDAGFKRGEICILGERNKDCTAWANELTNFNYKVVSADSLAVDSEPKVKMMLSYLKLRLNPNSQNEIKQFAEHYFRISHLNIEHYRSFFSSRLREDGSETNFFDGDKFIATFFQSRSKFLFKYENLYDLIQESYTMFRFKELDNPYLHHFSDMVHNYELHFGPDLQQFISDFETNTSNKAVQIPESDDAVKIMTIHKSKGLEFPVVIIPSMNGSSTVSSKNSFFVETNPFLLYTTLSASSTIDAIKNYLESENHQYLMDKINLFYVGLTRPIERLYINNQFVDKCFGQYFHEALLQLPETKLEGEEVCLKLGSKAIKKIHGSATSDQFFTPTYSNDNLWFPEIALQDREELLTEQLLSDEQRFGNQFHLAISKINAREKIDETIKALVDSSDIEAQNEVKIKSSLTTLFDSIEYTELFEGANKILNEQNFIVSRNEQLRPDKIIVKDHETIVLDYKTGIPTMKDKKQLKMYVKVMSEVGYKNVKGYLFYTAKSELEKIKL